jgi:GTPase SAR1 family protein
MSNRRIVIVGGPRCGKSTMARRLREEGVPTYCGDPKSLVKQPEEDVIYMPEYKSWSDTPNYVVMEWFSKPGPWCCEGVVMARALRKLKQRGWSDMLKGVEVIYLDFPFVPLTPGQAVMSKGIATVWFEVESFVRQFATVKTGGE